MERQAYQESAYEFKTWQVAQEYIPCNLIKVFSEQFRKFDKKHCGVLKTEDVPLILENLGRYVSTEQIKAILKDLIGEQTMPCSTDYVDFKEYISVLSVLMTECISEDDMYKVFCQFDLDGDGYISPEELEDLLDRIGDDITKDELAEMIMEADLDGDGRVSYDEFVCIVTNSDRSANMSSPPSPQFHDCESDDAFLEEKHLTDIKIVINEVSESSDTESTSAQPQQESNTLTKPQLQRMRSFSLGSPTMSDVPQKSHRRKKSISELLHLPSLTKGKSVEHVESRRSSVTACRSTENLRQEEYKRRYSTSGLHLKHLFKKNKAVT